MTDDYRASQEEARKRADQLGESARKFAIAINTGGIAVVTALAARPENPIWLPLPMLLFVIGIIVIGWNYHVAKTKELRRSGRGNVNLLPMVGNKSTNAETTNGSESLLWTNRLYYALSIALFSLGALIEIFSVSCSNA